MPSTQGWRRTRDLVIALVLCASIPAGAQTFASLQGRVFDPFGALVPGAIIRVQDESSGFDVSVRADSEARYYVFAVPNGTYTVTAEATGFRAERIDALNVDVGRTLVRDFHLAIGEIAETVLVRSETPLVDRASATVGHVVTARDRAGDPAQWSPLHRSRPARARIGGAFAGGVFFAADSRRRCARVQHRRQS